MQPKEIVLTALIAVAIHDEEMPISFFEDGPVERVCVRYWPAEDVLDVMAATAEEWWERFQEMVPFKTPPSHVNVHGTRMTTGVLQKCKDPYKESGRPWCIYKHKESDHDEALKRQPKGWPKHYKTKKDAEKALRIMESYRDE